METHAHNLVHHSGQIVFSVLCMANSKHQNEVHINQCQTEKELP